MVALSKLVQALLVISKKKDAAQATSPAVTTQSVCDVINKLRKFEDKAAKGQRGKGAIQPQFLGTIFKQMGWVTGEKLNFGAGLKTAGLMVRFLVNVCNAPYTHSVWNAFFHVNSHLVVRVQLVLYGFECPWITVCW